MLSLVLDACKDNRLVGKAERLRNHCHNHRNLRTGTIDAQLRLHVYTFIYIREEHLVCCLVEDACHTQYEDRPRIVEHGTQQLRIEFPAETGILRNQTSGKHHRTDEVDIEHIAHILAVHPIEIEEVQQDGDHDVQ